ncbi:MgtC/SapB family protein, partial [Ruthenibacterium lactatiformans]
MSFTGNMPATLFGECLLRIFLAALCGLVIGFERKARLKEAGVRTHLIVALGAALITIVSKYGFFDLALFAEGIKADPTRIAAQIVSGVGFLGAGMIFMRHRTLTGLTTAAGIWTTAGIGMAVGCGLYAVSLFSTALVVLTQLMLHRDYRWTRAPGCTAVCLRTQPGPSGLRQALAALDEMQVQVINLE